MEATEQSSVIHEPALKRSKYIEDPKARISQCVRVLYRNPRLIREQIIDEYVKANETSMIVQSVSKLLPDSFRVILQLSASERYAKLLQLPAIDKDTTTKGLYVDVLTIPASSKFWEKTESLSMDKPTDHPLNGEVHNMYVGSAAREKGFQHRVQYQHQNAHKHIPHSITQRWNLQ
jgi:hypothetical protein